MSIKVVGKVTFTRHVPIMHGWCLDCGTVVEGPQGEWRFRGGQLDSYHVTDCPQCGSGIHGQAGEAPPGVRTKPEAKP